MQSKMRPVSDPQPVGTNTVQGQLPVIPPDQLPPEQAAASMGAAQPAESDTLPPEALEAMHAAMAPPPCPRRRIVTTPPNSGPAWNQYAKQQVSGQ